MTEPCGVSEREKSQRRAGGETRAVLKEGAGASIINTCPPVCIATGQTDGLEMEGFSCSAHWFQIKI